MDRDTAITYHEGIAHTSGTLLLVVDKAHTVQTGTRPLIHPVLSFIRIGCFGCSAAAANPPLRLLITCTRRRRLRPLCHQRLPRRLCKFYRLYLIALLHRGGGRCLASGDGECGNTLRRNTANLFIKSASEISACNSFVRRATHLSFGCWLAVLPLLFVARLVFRAVAVGAAENGDGGDHRQRPVLDTSYVASLLLLRRLSEQQTGKGGQHRGQ